MSRMLHSPPPSSASGTADSGMNLGSVVMMVRPAADWGSSSRARSFASSGPMAGSTSFSINCLMRVLLPVRTGPTTPMRMSPPVRAPISRQTAACSIRSCFAKMLSPLFPFESHLEEIYATAGEISTMQSSASPSKSYFIQKNPKKLQKSVDKAVSSEYNISCRRCFGREATDDDRV